MLRFALSVPVILTLAGPAPSQATATKPNVLVLAVDDLNHWVGHLGRNKQTKTPNIDRLARMGVTFTHAYCAAPVCNPSRAALMSGLRPSTSGVYDNGIDWKPHIKPELTLTTQFLGAGYQVLGCGKIYHSNDHRASEWSEYGPTGGRDPAPKGDPGVGGIKFAPLDCKDEDMGDYRLASWTIAELEKKRDKPFFLACGFHKPHMPWNVPRKYYDMFPLETIELPSTSPNDLSDIPPAGVRMARSSGDHAAILKSGRWKDAVQGYLAAIAFLDAQVGRILDTFEKSAYKDNTIVVFWGDHGWHLGEKEHWRKFALWEEATRAPFIWVAPGATKPGGVCDRTVDFMGIYPTLCDLCGIATPGHVEGKSFKALLVDPKSPWNSPAVTTHKYQNHAVRTEKWRYIRYADGGDELYDHASDPYEWKNLAGDSKFGRIKQELAGSLPAKNVAEGKRKNGG